jgi:hypothetical protein
LKHTPASQVDLTFSSAEPNLTFGAMPVAFTDATQQTITVTINGAILGAADPVYKQFEITISAASTDAAYAQANVTYEGCDAVASDGKFSLTVY